MTESCTEETVLDAKVRKIHIKVEGRDVPIGKYVQNFLINPIVGILSSLKKIDVKDGSTVEITLRYKK
jgi:hypothetical protein